MFEEVQAAGTDAQGGFDLRGSLAAVFAIAGLFALILFSTFNNFIGGVYMALMDPYGLEMFSVEMWGAVFALGSTGFIVGGALIGKFGLGANPLRTLLIAVAVMGLLGAVFTLREWAWLYIAGIWLYLVLIPFVEAAEQTVIQRVVPLERQGRVFGFAMAFVPRHRPGLPGCRHHHDRRRPAGLPDSGLPPGFRFICAGGGGGEGRRLNTRTPPQQVRKRPGKVQEGVERPIRPRLP